MPADFDPLVVAETETPYAVLDAKGNVKCPHCGHKEQFARVSVKAKNKKIELSLLVHPQWLKGSLKHDGKGREFGGSATDSAEATAAWNQERARQMRLIEVRGEAPQKSLVQKLVLPFAQIKPL